MKPYIIAEVYDPKLQQFYLLSKDGGVNKLYQPNNLGAFVVPNGPGVSLRLFSDDASVIEKILNESIIDPITKKRD